MKKDRELKVKREEEVEKPKKEFKIEIVKVGKLEENTGMPIDLPTDVASCLPGPDK